MLFVDSTAFVSKCYAIFPVYLLVDILICRKYMRITKQEHKFLLFSIQGCFITAHQQKATVRPERDVGSFMPAT